jgi:hypothetical protein
VIGTFRQVASVKDLATPRPAPTFAPSGPRRLGALKSWLLVLVGTLLVMSTAFAAGRPSVFFDTDGYYLMGENLAQLIKRVPDVLRGDPAALTTQVSDDDQIDIAIMGARSPFYGLLLFASDKVGGLWTLAAIQAAASAWMMFLIWRAAAPTAPIWSYPVLMAALAAGSTLPLFATFAMPDVFAALCALGVVLLAGFADRIRLWEKVCVFLVMAAGFSFHTSHGLTILVALVPATVLLLAFRAPPRAVLIGAGLTVVAIGMAVAGDRIYEAGFRMRTGHDLGRPPFLMARVLADGPGRAYVRKVCAGPGEPFVICRFSHTPLARSDDILWEDKPEIGVFSTLKPADQILMEKQEMAFVRGSVLNDPLGQLRASLRNWGWQLIKISTHDPLRDPRAFLANEYWKTTRVVDLIPDPRACKPIGPGCRPPLHPVPMKWLHTAVLALSLLFGAWRFSRPDARAALRARDWARPSTRLFAISLILLGIVVLNAGVCGVLSGAFSRYQARIIWLVPAAAGLAVCGLGFAWPARLRWKRVRLRRDAPAAAEAA